VSDSRPLSDMQQAMLVQEALAGHPMYTMPVCAVITGRLDAGALEHALHHVMGRHPVLLSTYDGDVAQPYPGRPPALERVTSQAPATAPALTALWDTLFDLASEPPVRAVLVSSPPDEHVLGLAVHHVAGDSWSLALVLRELGAAYAAVASGARPDLGQAADFFDYAAWEQEQQWDGAWWRDQLRGLPAQPVAPASLPGQAEPGDEARRGMFDAVGLDLDADDTRQIRGLARTGRVSPATVLFTAVSAAVAGDRRESVVGLPAVIRDTARSQATVGPLINTLPVRTAWPAGLHGAGLLAAHADSMETALAHKDVPYPAILRAAGIPRGPGAAPLLVHVVNFDTVVAHLPLPGLHATVRPVPPRWANLPALWEFTWGTVGNIRGVLRSDAAYLGTSDASELAGRFRYALRHLLLEPR
jgi:Condensation domain